MRVLLYDRCFACIRVMDEVVGCPHIARTHAQTDRQTQTLTHSDKNSLKNLIGGVLLAMIEGINIMFTRLTSEQFKPQPPSPPPDDGPPPPIFGDGAGGGGGAGGSGYGSYGTNSGGGMYQ